MKRKVCILLMAFFFIFSINAFADTDVVAILEEVHGEVFVTRSGGKVEFIAKEGMKIHQGDSVRTGNDSSVKINFGDGNESTLGDYSKVTIAELANLDEEPSDGEFSIMSKYLGKKVTVKKKSGSMWSKVKNVAESGNRHKVQTSTAIMGVRGTLFLTYEDQNLERTRLSVFAGAVETMRAYFEGQRDGRFVNPGEGVNVDSTSIYDINFLDFVNQVNPRVSLEIIEDTVEETESQLSKAQQLMNYIEQQMQILNQEALQAMQQAQIAEVQALIASRTIEAFRNSSRASEINELLEGTIEQRQQHVNSLRQRAENTRRQVDEIVDNLNIPEREVREAREEGQRLIDRISEQTAPSTPTTGGGGGGGGSSPSTINVTGVEISPKKANLILYEEIQLDVRITPENATNQSVTWESDNTNVAKVDNNGLVTAVGPGEAVITVTTVDGDHVAEAQIFVDNKALNRPTGSYEFHSSILGDRYLELHWNDPVTEKTISYYNIYYSPVSISDIDDAYSFAGVDDPNDFGLYTINVSDLYDVSNLEEFYIYIVAFYHDETSSLPLELKIVNDSSGDKLANIIPSWIEDEQEQYYIGVRYESTSPINFVFLKQLIGERLETARFYNVNNEEVFSLDFGFSEMYLLNLKDIHRIDIKWFDDYNIDKEEDEDINDNIPIALYGDYIEPTPSLIKVEDEANDRIIVKLHEQYSNYSILYLYVDDQFYYSIDPDDPDMEDTFTIEGLESDTTYLIKCFILVNDEPLIGEIEVAITD